MNRHIYSQHLIDEGHLHREPAREDIISKEDAHEEDRVTHMRRVNHDKLPSKFNFMVFVELPSSYDRRSVIIVNHIRRTYLVQKALLKQSICISLEPVSLSLLLF